MSWWSAPGDLDRWTARLVAMQKCETVEQLVAAYGPPSHKAEAPLEIWHYPLGVLNGMLYSIHAVIEGRHVSQLYIHMVPAKGGVRGSRDAHG